MKRRPNLYALQRLWDAEARYRELRREAEAAGLDEPPLLVGAALLVALFVILAVGLAALPTTGAFR